jgi:hypothetical protein
MWKRINDLYDKPRKDHEPDPKREKLKTKIKDRGSVLRAFAREMNSVPGPDTDPGANARREQHRKQATAARGNLLKAMQKFTRFLKNNKKQEDPQQYHHYFPAVKQLTVSVADLDLNGPDEADGGPEVDLSALESVDVTALDEALEQPGFGEGDDDDANDGEATKEKVTSTAPQANDHQPDPTRKKNYEGAAKVWALAAEHARTQLQSLKQTLTGYGDEVPAKAFTELDRLLNDLPELEPQLHGLATAFAEGKAGDISTRSTQARAAYQECQKYLNDPLVTLIRGNPFVPVDLKQLLGKPLEVLGHSCPELV